MDKNITNYFSTRFISILQIIVTGIRILIGWHFLYEGVTKIFAPNWTAAGYLVESHWFLSGIFHWIAVNSAILKIVDFLNIFGLIVIGLGLLFGVLTRIAAGAGAFLILLYYLANPPFPGFIAETTTEGHYLVVNKNMIEFVLLLLLMVLPTHLTFGLDRWLARLNVKKNRDRLSDLELTSGRREILKDLVTIPAFAGFVYALFKKKQWESFEERHLISQPSRVDATTGASPVGGNFAKLVDLTGKLPCGKIGNLNLSRLMAGGNLISGYAHARDLIYVSSLVQSYFNDEKVLETLRLCEACGINTIIMRVDKNTLRIVEKYRKRQGKIQWIAQTKITETDIRADIDAAIDFGAVAAYVHGGICDNLVKNGQIDLLHKSVEYIKQNRLLAGIAGHALEVPIACEREGVNPDFYMKTLNSGNYWTAGPRLPKPENWQPQPHEIVDPEFIDPGKDNIWSVTPQQTIEFMRTLKKPWIAYKVLGAGAIHPEEGFKYAFDNGADFICVGMFDFQVVEDANIAMAILSGTLTRERQWFA